MNTAGAVRSSHAWSLADAAEVTPEALESWVAARLEAHKTCLDRLLAGEEAHAGVHLAAL